MRHDMQSNYCVTQASQDTCNITDPISGNCSCSEALVPCCCYCCSFAAYWLVEALRAVREFYLLNLWHGSWPCGPTRAASLQYPLVNDYCSCDELPNATVFSSMIPNVKLGTVVQKQVRD